MRETKTSLFDAFSINSDHQQHHVDDDSFSGYGGYSGFSGGDVSIDHTSLAVLPEIFGLSDLEPSYSQSPFEPVHAAENGNGNRNGNGYDHGIFLSKPVLPPSGEMELEEGYAF